MCSIKAYFWFRKHCMGAGRRCCEKRPVMKKWCAYWIVQFCFHRQWYLTVKAVRIMSQIMRLLISVEDQAIWHRLWLKRLRAVFDQSRVLQYLNGRKIPFCVELQKIKKPGERRKNAINIWQSLSLPLQLKPLWKLLDRPSCIPPMWRANRRAALSLLEWPETSWTSWDIVFGVASNNSQNLHFHLLLLLLHWTQILTKLD